MNSLQDNKVLLIGDGPHLNRYIYSFLFNPHRYECIAYKSTNYLPSTLAFICICEPFGMNTFYEQIIKKYQARVLIEKIPFKNCNDLDSFLDKMQDAILIPVSVRLYEDKIVNRSNREEYVIEWPNKSNTGMDPIWSTLPNVLDFIVKQFDVIDIENIEIKEVYKIANSIDIKIYVQKMVFLIRIYDTTSSDKVHVNQKELEWPNYLDLYSRVIYDAELIDLHSAAMKWNYIRKEIKIITRMEKLYYENIRMRKV